MFDVIEAMQVGAIIDMIYINMVVVYVSRIKMAKPMHTPIKFCQTSHYQHCIIAI